MIYLRLFDDLFPFLYSLRNLIFISQLKGQINYELDYEYNEGKCTVCAAFFFLCVMRIYI